MATKNISLPGPLCDWVESQSACGVYANNGDYVRDLIRKDQLRIEKIRTLQDAITKGFNSADAGR